MKKTLFIVFLSLSVAFLQAQTDDLRAVFEQELQSKNAETTTISCDFVQIRSVAVLTEKIEKKGHFYLVVPDKILFDFTDGDQIKLTSDHLEMRTNGRTTTIKIASNSGLRNLKTLISTSVSGKMKQLFSELEPKIIGNEKEWQIMLTPQRSATKMQTIEMVFDRKTMALKMLKITEKSGDYTLFKFTKTVFNQPVDNALFELQKR